MTEGYYQQMPESLSQYCLRKVEEAREMFPRTPTPRMVAAAWDVVDKAKRGSGITRLMPGLGVVEIWEAMHDAATHDSQEPFSAGGGGDREAR